MQIKLTLNTDGGSRGNPGPAAGGAVIKSADGEVLKTASLYFGETTNNQAEYRALILGLEAATKLNPQASLLDTDLTIKMDSELIVRQMMGQYKVKSPDLIDLHLEARQLTGRFGKSSFVHVPRSQNAEADALVNQVLDKLGK